MVLEVFLVLFIQVLNTHAHQQTEESARLYIDVEHEEKEKKIEKGERRERRICMILCVSTDHNTWILQGFRIHGIQSGLCINFFISHIRENNKSSIFEIQKTRNRWIYNMSTLFS
jgi:hypothetical protein